MVIYAIGFYFSDRLLNEEKMVQRKLLERELIEKVNVHTDKIKEQEKAIEYIMDRLAYVIQTQQPNIKKRLTKTPIHKCEAIVDEQRR